jgi:hypothetical protein
VEFTKLKEYEIKLRGKSGLYYFYKSNNPEGLLYVGEAIDLYRRMKQYHQKDRREGHNNPKVVGLIENELDSLKVAFQPIEDIFNNKKELKKFLQINNFICRDIVKPAKKIEPFIQGSTRHKQNINK